MEWVHVLFGETGEYSDRQEWVVRAYADEEAAHSACATLNALARPRDGEVRVGDPGESGGREAMRMRLLAHDANAQVDYTGTTYSVTPVPFIA